jgi:UDP-2,4-diacetamido-2,4,6-trideoxy-beta-L-altropyranose hydrolase
MRVAFRVDSSPDMGTGHFMRCLCLADRLHGQGASIRFVGRISEASRRWLAGRPHELVPLPPVSGESITGDLPHSQWLGTSQAADVDATARALGAGVWDWLVVDHYGLDARWETAMRAHASRILAIDDLADRQHDCDLLLDQNLHADAATRYAGKVPRHCQTLIGPRFALLRDEFASTRRCVGPRRGPVSRVLVSFGGSDRDDHTSIAVEAVRTARLDVPVDVVVGSGHPRRDRVEALCRESGFAFHVDSPRMAELMAAADLAVGCGGVTAWERCCLGVPSLTVVLAANQAPMVDGAALAGLIDAPIDGPVTADALVMHLRALAANSRLREMLSRRGMEAVDGDGAGRLVRLMDREAIRVRPATADDADSLFEWRNHESVRSFMKQQALIPRPAHDAWLAGVLSNPNRVLLIGERHGAPVGVVRFDIDGAQAWVSTYLVPGTSERGLGSMLQLATEAWLAERRPDVTTVLAEVLADNVPSHGFLKATGYQLQCAIYEKRIRW